MPKKIRLTRKRLQWAEPRAATLRGSPLVAPAATAAKYSAELERMVQAMRKEYDSELRGLFKQLGSQIGPDTLAQDASLASQARILFSWLSTKYAKLFASRASTITERMISGASKASQVQLGESLKKISGGLTIKVADMPGDLADRLTASTAENVGLIKSIQAQYHEKISQTVLRSIQAGGNGSQDIFGQIRHIDGVTENRAKLIAIDQTRKVTTAMNVERAASAGIKKFEWLHSGGGADPRRLHLDYDGQIFDYDKPPVIDERTGERGYPGQLPNCRCAMIPVISFGEEENG